MALIAPFIGWAFGLLWLSVGLGVTPAPWKWIAGLIYGAVAVIAAIRILRQRNARGGSFDRRWYLAAVVAEVVAIMVAAHWLAAHHRTDLTFPVVGVLVGLHFLGLWPSFALRRFVVLAFVLVAINLAAIFLPLSPEERLMLSGFGSSAALLLTAAA